MKTDQEVGVRGESGHGGSGCIYVFSSFKFMCSLIILLYNIPVSMNLLLLF